MDVVTGLAGQVGSIAGGLVDGYHQDPNLMQVATPEQLAAQQQAVTAAQQGQSNFVNALQGQNGVQNQSNVFNQMQGVANGTGPNPAQAQLANSTGANVANQAALMAGQRGASSNPALIARQAAMQGANTQQQAAGQGAALQAQQSLGALNQMGTMAGQQVNQLGNAIQGQASGALQGQSNLMGGANSMNQLNAANTAGRNQAVGNVIGGVMQGAGAAMGLMAEGGQVKSGPQSFVGKHFAMMANGGPVQAIVSPGEKYLDPQAVQQVAKGANPMKAGETIPGKPKVGGAKDSYANDVVPKTLQEGGIVLPRSVTQAKDADAKAHAFVQAILNKKSK